MRTTLLLVLLLTSIALRAQRYDNDSLYNALDETIEQADEYIAQKQHRIDELHRVARNATNDLSRYEAEMKLHSEYMAYMNDSAIAALNRAIALADTMKRMDLKAVGYTKMGMQLARSGFYTEAMGYLQNIPVEKEGQTLIDFFYGMSYLYGEMGAYTKDRHMQPLYYAQSSKYRDSLFNHLPPTSSLYLSLKESEAFNSGRYEEAMQFNDQRLALAEPGSHDYATVAFYRSLIYHETNRRQEEEAWLAMSALADIKLSIMDQASLWTLARRLSADGQLERSYRYVDYSWRCTSRYSTHVRQWLVAPVLTMINDNYKAKVVQSYRRLTVAIIAISLLTLLLAGSYVYVSRKRKQLAIARNELKTSNDELKAVNAQLSAINIELEQRSRELAESNKMKDEYLGKYMSLCSSYIDKLEQFRLKVNRKMKSKQLDELFRISQNDEMKEDELKELLQNFDASFLHLFPHFVDDFNALLKPEHRIVPTDNKSLPTDLRIFALIRLGIEDSSHIAEFLNYSPNTIYNYRARIKGKALGERDDFENKVKQIGMKL